MKAFLLAAGLGTRLKPLTNNTPKCLLPIKGKPLLQIWLEQLERHGIDEVLINTHWLDEEVNNFIINAQGTKTKWPKIRLFHEPVLLGSAGTLWVNRDWIPDGQPFFILYGDNLTNTNLIKMLDFHKQHDMPFTLGVFKAERPEACGIAEIDKDDIVTEFIEKPKHPKSDLASAGIFIADNRIFDFFPYGSNSIIPLDMGFHVIPKLINQMKAYLIEEFLLDIGTPEAYKKAQELYSKSVCI